ncbi:MAG: chromosomal replication initiator protein DnaA [Clostridia bacterium]|nr:chromosomal replication initiator protein DnaA [Clostridia bacterium]
MNSYKEIWELVLKELGKRYSEYLIDLWFKNLELAYLDDTYAFLLAKDDGFFVDLLNTRYAQQIEASFEEAMGFPVKVKIFSKDGFSVENAIMSLNSPVIQEDDTNEDDEDTSAGSEKSYGAYSATDKEYTFETFVVGSSNKFAHAVSVAVASNPAEEYNPLFIYGSSGLGKTHLMKAIAYKVKKDHPEFKIVFIKGDDFTNELVASISKKTMAAFKEKYRKVDMLLVDDVQFIAGKVATQEEFFHTFNTLFENHKQIILTSDRPPKEIQHLEDRIKTRFEGGMIADIQPPDTELRIAILKRKAEIMNVNLPNDVLTFIGENIKSNIRQIEGVIKKLGAYSYITQSPITVDIAKNQLSSFISVNASPTETAEKVIASVSKIYDVPVEDIKSKKRSKEISTARHVSVYVIRKVTQMPVVDIGKIFNRDHTTVLASIDVVSNEIASNPETERIVSGLIKEFS